MCAKTVTTCAINSMKKGHALVSSTTTKEEKMKNCEVSSESSAKKTKHTSCLQCRNRYWWYEELFNSTKSTLVCLEKNKDKHSAYFP